MQELIRTLLATEFKVDQINRSIDSETMSIAQGIVDEVKTNGMIAVRKYAEQFAERKSDEPVRINAQTLQEAAGRVDAKDLEMLQRVAARIRSFAEAQLGSLNALDVEVPGGRAGHTVEPIERVGCYAPAGRFPLPSTVLMTAVTARVAGSQYVVVATPNPSDVMLAAAWVAGADEVLAVGGAHAIALMAYGDEENEGCDLICGPGSRWVTAAKKIVTGDCGIDMLAGPSELVIIADHHANADTVAADLLAQAEHDVDARPMLVVTSDEFAEQVVASLATQLETLETANVAKVALSKSAIIVASDLEQAIDIGNQLAPEHLELHCQNAEEVAEKIRHAGCVFVGHDSAEVFGDYGVGPNHTLPTAGTARWSAGLNVFTFLRIRTWLRLDQAPKTLIDDTARLAELEGLHGHRNAALRRQ